MSRAHDTLIENAIRELCFPQSGFVPYNGPLVLGLNHRLIYGYPHLFEHVSDTPLLYQPGRGMVPTNRRQYSTKMLLDDMNAAIAVVKNSLLDAVVEEVARDIQIEQANLRQQDLIMSTFIAIIPTIVVNPNTFAPMVTFSGRYQVVEENAL